MTPQRMNLCGTRQLSAFQRQSGRISSPVPDTAQLGAMRFLGEAPLPCPQFPEETGTRAPHLYHASIQLLSAL